MHKFTLNIFEYLKNIAHFLKILVIFIVVMFFIFWAQNLAGADWTFIDFIEPCLNSFLVKGKSLWQGELNVLNITIEYQYLGALVIFALLYVLAHLLGIGLEVCENVYKDGRNLIKKNEERLMNESLQKAVIQNEKKIRQYKLYVSTELKKKSLNSKNKINLEEQNKILNKFIMEKTMANPVFYNNGFLYSFSNIEKIDKVLDALKKILQTDSPINYFICIQVFGENPMIEEQELKDLISTKIPNKIIMTAKTSYRYSYNEEQRYKTGQYGIFQSNGKSFEVHIFDVE